MSLFTLVVFHTNSACDVDMNRKGCILLGSRKHAATQHDGMESITPEESWMPPKQVKIVNNQC